MYDALLFLHVLSAAIAFATLAIFSAFALGARVDAPSLSTANWAWNISGAGLFFLGLALALDVDGYEIWSGWVLLALVGFAFATETGRRAMEGAEAAVKDGTAMASSAVTMHWLRTLFVVLVLADMIWKPWAG